MPRKKKQTEQVFKIKKRTQELGETLARKMFKLQHNEPTINDVIERLIILEAHKFGLLDVEETRAVLEFYGLPPVDTEMIAKSKNPINDYIEKNFKKEEPKSNSLLPLGNISTEDR